MQMLISTIHEPLVLFLFGLMLITVPAWVKLKATRKPNT